MALNSQYEWHDYVQRELELFRRYVSKLEDMINAEVFDFENRLQENDAVDPSRNLKPHSPDYFPNLQRQSQVIAIYGFLEYALKELCKCYENSLVSNVRASDLRGSGIEQYQLYLVKIAGLDVSRISNSRDDMINLKDLRNCIVHQEGKLSAESTALRQYINKQKYLELKNENINISEGFLMVMLLTIESFFYDVQKLIQEK